MTSYRLANLKRYLEKDGLLLLAYEDEEIIGAALCYELLHPAGEDSLYVHELDTRPNYRRQGVATALMREAISIAKQRGLTEVWVGADEGSEANEFYKSTYPDETDPSIIYAYKLC